jgi:hypothetical protein
MISLKNRSVSIKFDRVTKTVNVSIFGIKMTSYDPYVVYIAKGNSNEIKENYLSKFLKIIGHCGVDYLKTANIHGLKLKGEFKVCEDYAFLGKSEKRKSRLERRNSSTGRKNLSICKLNQR